MQEILHWNRLGTILVNVHEDSSDISSWFYECKFCKIKETSLESLIRSLGGASLPI